MSAAEEAQDFLNYCKAQPQLRFWQALRNWSDFNFILASNSYDGNDARDTFYLEHAKEPAAGERSE